jgi:hypothetical protein
MQNTRPIGTRLRAAAQQMWASQLSLLRAPRALVFNKSDLRATAVCWNLLLSTAFALPAAVLRRACLFEEQLQLGLGPRVAKN